MPRFEVTISQKRKEYTSVIVEAENRSEAEDMAFDIVNVDTAANFKWRPDEEPSDDDFDVDAIIQLKDKKPDV